MNRLFRNRKAVIKTIALILLLFAVTMGAAIVYISTAGSAEARAEFISDSVDKLNDMQGMKTFYSHMVEYATVEALIAEGHEMGATYYCCPEIPDGKYDWRIGKECAEGVSHQTETYCKSSGSGLSCDDFCSAGGAYDMSTAACTCNPNFCPARVDEKSARYSAIEKVEAWIEHYGKYKEYPLPQLNIPIVEEGIILEKAFIGGALELEKDIREDELDRLIVEGYPADPLKVSGRGIEITSTGVFSFSLEQTAEEKPDITVENIQFRDSTGKHIYTEKEVEAGLESGGVSRVTAEVHNKGCAIATGVEADFYVDTEALVTKRSLGDLDIGEMTRPVEKWEPYLPGTYTIRVEASTSDSEIDSGNNDAEKTVEIVEPTGTSYYDRCNTNTGDCSNPTDSHCAKDDSGNNVVDCCNWYQRWHIHDLGSTLSGTVLLKIRYNPSATSYGKVYVSTSVNGPWDTHVGDTSSTKRLTPVTNYFLVENANFRYVKVEASTFYVDGSSATAWEL